MAEEGCDKMKITKRQLKRIIKEELLREQITKDPEYKRGYSDGLARKPVADDANDAYHEGYEDGEMQAEAEETGG